MKGTNIHVSKQINQAREEEEVFFFSQLQAAGETSPLISNGDDNAGEGLTQTTQTTRSCFVFCFVFLKLFVSMSRLPDTENSSG